ncbi:hypothetical protein, partial [Pseudomonas sp. PS02285]|uniref:hypothetical protein n=1 Tax=Pseudomonas sp. PS02285 TaxID=2991441 RepID=UPI00249B5EBA
LDPSTVPFDEAPHLLVDQSGKPHTGVGDVLLRVPVGDDRAVDLAKRLISQSMHARADQAGVHVPPADGR